MDRLPPEIISNIVHHVGDGSRTPLSVLCRQWQPIVEAKIYRELRLSYGRPIRKQRWTEIRDPSHARIANILTPTRLSYIRRLDVEFDRYNRPGPDNVTRHAFDLLTRIPHTQEPLLHVIFSFFGFFSDFFEPSSLSSDTAESTPLDGLPELPMIRFCWFTNITKKYRLSTSTLLYMASKMSRLRTLDVITWESESIHQRVELARSLTNLPAFIHSFFLRYRQDDNSEGLLVMENGEDILTREVRRFSQREGLKEFLFSGYAELSIFWPPDSATSEPRHWPTLESFRIELRHPQHLAILYATESPDVAQDANDSDRTDVRKEIMSASFRALSKCSACMPKAEENYVYFGDTWRTRFAYCTMFPEDPCVTVTGRLDFELDEETLDEWRKTAEVHNSNFQMCVEGWTE